MAHHTKPRPESEESLVDVMKVMMMQEQQLREEDRQRREQERRDENRGHNAMMEMMMVMVAGRTGAKENVKRSFQLDRDEENYIKYLKVKPLT